MGARRGVRVAVGAVMGAMLGPMLRAMLRWTRRAGVLTVVMLLAVGAGAPSSATVCGTDVAAGDVAALRAAFASAQADATTAACVTWEMRLSGTYTVAPADGPLVHGGAVTLRVVGPAGGAATITASGSGTRLIDASDGGRLVLARLVLTGGAVEGVPGGVGGDNLGGAVRADVVHLLDSVLEGNSAVGGGAVHAREVLAERVAFVDNAALTGPAQGGAIRATEKVTLINVTLADNLAAQGGAVWLPATGTLDATFVTFRGNEVSEAFAGADLHLGLTGSGSVRLRGVLFAGVDDFSDGPSCGGVALSASGMTLEVDGSFEVVDDVLDLSCDEAAPIVGPLTLTTVPFLGGAAALPVADGGPAALGAVACGAGWPADDQRGVARPQGTTCDAGAVERIVTSTPPEPPEPPGTDPDDDPPVTSGSADAGAEPSGEEVVGGPVPTSVPAGDGACADDGCADSTGTFSRR